jgi:hypothetical protein
MGTKLLTFAAMVLVVTIGYEARIVYEQTLRPAFAQDDPRVGLDCEDYNSQADAQAALKQDPSDPNVLDEDNDGVACEIYPYPLGTPSDETPVPVNGSGSDGSASPAPSSSSASPAPSPGSAPPQPTPNPSGHRREPPTPRTGGLRGGALPARPDGSCPAKYPVKYQHICLAHSPGNPF